MAVLESKRRAASMPFSVQFATREDAAVMQPMLRAYQQILAGYSASADADRET